jgi:hypothetical protein
VLHHAARYFLNEIFHQAENLLSSKDRGSKLIAVRFKESLITEIPVRGSIVQTLPGPGNGVGE